MRTVFTAIAATTILTASVFADDNTSPTESWEGPYIGAQVGAGNGDFDSNFEIDGAIFGGQIGFRHALDDRIVLGIEVSGRYSGMEGSELRNLCSPVDGCSYTLDRTTTVNNRFGGEILVEAGVTVGDFLVSAVAGPAWRQYEETRFYDYTGATWNDDTYSNTDNLVGVAFGGRLSYQAFTNTSVEIEYLQVQVDGASWESTSGPNTYSGGMDADEGILSVRINFRR